MQHIAATVAVAFTKRRVVLGAPVALPDGCVERGAFHKMLHISLRSSALSCMGTFQSHKMLQRPTE